MIKNIKSIAKASSRIDQRNTSTWLPIFYSIKEKALYTTEGPNRFFVTKLIRENTTEEIEAAVNRWLAL